MRPILFRGRKSDGTWLQGDLNHIGGRVYIFPRSEDFPIADLKQCEVQPETVGQFKGLDDKNGTPIFEGDVLCVAFVDGYTQSGFGNSKAGQFMKKHEADMLIRIDSRDQPLHYTLMFRRNGKMLLYGDVYMGSADDLVFTETGDSFNFLQYTCGQYLAIIGSIHDNPELLQP